MIIIENLSKRFNKTKVFEHLSITLAGKRTVLIGPNGSGKTTLFRCIVGFYQNYGGNIRIPPGQGGSIGYLPQFFSIFPHLTVKEALELCLSIQYPHFQEATKSISRCLEMTNLTAHAHILVKNLSGGMKRRLGIAQAFLGEPALIVLDEPFVGLDPEERVRVMEAIRNYDGSADIVLSTHIANDGHLLNADIVLLDRGVILFHGSEGDFIKPYLDKVYCIENNQELPEGSLVIRREVEEGREFTRFFCERPGIHSCAIRPTIEDVYMIRIAESNKFYAQQEG